MPQQQPQDSQSPYRPPYAPPPRPQPYLPHRFGVFLAPYHRPDGDPALQLRRDLDLAADLDRLGYEELWAGEHHSAGYEIIASPEVFLAAAAERTSRIMLGTGVNSLPYHQPLILADRICQLDQQSRGRAMLGVGPGQLPSDACMMGVDPLRSRAMTADALDAIVRLLRGETVTAATEWFALEEARLQLGPYRGRELEVAVASAVSPTGAVLAGRHGVGMLSLAAADPAGYGALDANWAAHERACGEAGRAADRTAWRLVTPVHLAETREQALREAEYGTPDLVDYIEKLSGTRLDGCATPAGAVERWTTEGLPTFGRAVIGTPEDAVQRVEQLADKTGGFGTFLILRLDLAEPAAALRSLELFAERVVPRLTGHTEARRASLEWAGRNSERFVGAMRRATMDAIARKGEVR
ncbi:LLM class flavin-dependent oxidoreductase [Streptomyces sp. NBC_00193]|uniref:LLM class flavin-dependent oxidoreductase n=1 Tax=Streptomyces sp. NBC_00193 TaxID=2975675 RepID=UPI00225AE5DB|nr:LLM class flavin-dependent oxidoreductase [Streptomyces sp. NBC_00193]MCX5300196.1 LLM class flavin-dependent oxidoreductase [Streptomyces sp. NBC_00193]